MNYRVKFLLHEKNPRVPWDLLGQTFLYYLLYFIQCINVVFTF